MRFSKLLLLTALAGQLARADIFPSKPPLPCELVLEALGVSPNEAKRVPLYHIDKSGMKIFGGGDRIVLFGHILDPITHETRWIYTHAGQRRPTSLDMSKLKISKSFPNETITLEGRVSGVAEAWANATPLVVSDILPDVRPMSAHELRQIRVGTVLRDRSYFYVVRSGFDLHAPESLDVLVFDDGPRVGQFGRRLRLPVDPGLSELRIVGQVRVDETHRVVGARLMDPMPAAKTGRLVERPVKVTLELSRWSTLP